LDEQRKQHEQSIKEFQNAQQLLEQETKSLLLDNEKLAATCLEKK